MSDSTPLSPVASPTAPDDSQGTGSGRPPSVQCERCSNTGRSKYSVFPNCRCHLCPECQARMEHKGGAFGNVLYQCPKCKNVEIL